MSRAVLLALTLLAAGCSFLTSFDPDTQACDTKAPRPDQECLPGYTCVEGVCVSLPDAGADAGG